ncbi:tetratricopeptide repeat protein [Chromobacterium sp. IIBBL 290-4]|uniref:tetratricopeptide repeat protein n=1 Tax=Chromobacterium sp. IIBBL 290-4 TaxID=2953890 RepID=UPI0020B7C118|nr:tetratricopeptide repeat protein [Chromobacterium sp. IIBBL 290-4]UTH72918.1 tetratricopeptide repeat protein [Chromobacterium sp. IIBBL 290-4]
MHIALENIRKLQHSGQTEQALRQARELLSHQPQHADLHYLTASLHDSRGEEAAAIPHYLQALELGLSGADAAGAWLGLGSSYRALGKFQEAEQALLEGLHHFPADLPLQTFLAMARYNLGKHKLATESLLTLLAQTSVDEDIRRYERAIRFYAQDLDKTW